MERRKGVFKVFYPPEAQIAEIWVIGRRAAEQNGELIPAEDVLFYDFDERKAELDEPDEPHIVHG